MIKKYRKKPVVIEAVQWTGQARPMFDFLTGTENELMTDSGENFHIEFDNGACSLGTLVIHTLEGPLRSSFGDYIIKGVKGEFCPCKPDVFEMTYEEVGE